MLMLRTSILTSSEQPSHFPQNILSIDILERKECFNQNRVLQQHKKLMPGTKYMIQSCKNIIAEARYILNTAKFFDL